MQGISVIICCYNSGNKLLPTLNHLAKQQMLPGINYEIIIVDNNCTDNTIAIASDEWASLGTPFPLVIKQECIAGLNHARETGVKNAHFEYLVLCDDDNWLFENYLVNVYHLFVTKPEIALIGGVGEAASDKPIPAWFKELDGFGYAVGAEGRQTGYVDSVYGAGMAIRKPVFLAILNNEFPYILSDRTGKDLSSGGDTEISMLVKNAGYKIYLDRSLKFKHFLNNERLQWSYYLKLRRSFGNATAYLQLYNKEPLSANSLQKKNRVKQFLSLTKFAVRHLKYILFSPYFKNEGCAGFFEQMGMRITCLVENKKIQMVSDRIKTSLKEKQAFQQADVI